MRKLFAALLLGFAALPAAAQEDHLAPEDSVIGGTAFLSDYDEKVRSLLKDAYANNVVVRMVVIPSFSEEYAIGLVSKTNGRDAPYSVFTVTSSTSLWTYQSINQLRSGEVRAISRDGKDISQAEAERLRATVPDEKAVTARKCVADIDQAVASRIVAVWRAMLLKTQYPQRDGLDGVTFHFYWGGYGMMAGQVWSPERNSGTGNLVALAEAMGDFCNKKPGVNEAELSKLTSELEGRLK